MRHTAVFYGWYVVAAAFTVLFAGFGVVYAFGAFFLPVADTFKASRAEVSAVFAYATALIFVTGAFSGTLADRYGPRRVVFIGGCAMIAGLVGSATADSLAAVTACFTLGLGLGVGFMYVPSLGAVQAWFVRRRGLATGITVTGIGLGTIAIPFAAGWLLETMDWPSVMFLLAVLVATLCLPASLLLDADPAKRGLNPDGGGVIDPALHGDGGERWSQLISSRPFVQLYLAQLAMSFVVMLPFVHLVPAAEDLGVTTRRAVILLGLLGVGSTLGRILVGAIADRFGRAQTLVLAFACSGVAYVLWASAASYPPLVAFALAYGVCYGGFIALMPALLADYFAGPRLSSIIGLQYTSAAFGSLLGPIAAGYIFDARGSYTLVLGFAAALCALGAILIATTPQARPH